MEARMILPQPSLADELVSLRPWEVGDAACVAQGVGLEPAASLQWIARQRRKPADGLGMSLAICTLADTDAQGYVGLLLRPRLEIGPRRGPGGLVFQPQTGRAGIGYWVLEGSRGRGLATHAVTLVSRWALTTAGLTRVEALVEPHNAASRRVAEAAGFQLEGQLRAYLELAAGPADAVVYSLLAADLERGR
jgi:[ribosomal protein S5]-alanine N-acetyltransferase